MKILWHSNAPWSPTGYGVETKLFAWRIKEMGHEVAISAFYGLDAGSLDLGGIRILPKGHRPYSSDGLVEHSKNWGADISLTLIDAWVYDPYMMLNAGLRWVPWFPIDSEPIPRKVYSRAKLAWRRIVFSRFGERMCHNADLDCYYVPHGIDTSVFFPGDKRQAREAMGLPQDRYIVGMVAANKGFPPRKSWPEALIAFSEFRKKHTDALLYLQTTPDERFGGVDLLELIDSLALTPDHVKINNAYFANIGIDDHLMSAAYNSLDVLLSPSRGEGFGIPIVEAQACGVSVIVGDWTSMHELCFSGWKIPRDTAHLEWTQLGAYQFIPHPQSIVDALEESYRVSGNTDYRKRAVKGAQRYDADKVAEKYWKPVLADIEDSLEERVEVEEVAEVAA